MGIITALSATGLAAGLALTGANAASASVTLPTGGALEQRVTKFCGRIPDLLERVDKAQTRISADAETKGSLAWLEARKDAAQTLDRDQIVRRVERRIERRTERLAALPEVKEQLIAAQGECADLDLPDSSGS